jgi:hypothetical protein
VPETMRDLAADNERLVTELAGVSGLRS